MKYLKPFDHTGQHQVDPVGLRAKAIRGAGATVMSSGLNIAIQIAAAAVLARLLVPADFGVVAMVTTFSLLLANVGFNGITEAIIQREQMNHGLASNLFWINVAVGVVLTVAFTASGQFLAWFYDSPQVRAVAVGMSLSILLSSAWVVHSALLRRAMMFYAVVTIDVIAKISSVLVSIAFGLAGWGYWALVAGQLAVPLTTIAGVWTACRWIPGRPRHCPGTIAMLRFAMNVYGRFMTNYGSRNVDKLLVGWRFGNESLGLYKKVYDLFALSASALVSPLTHVAVAALSRLSGQPREYMRYLLGALQVVAFVGMGVGGLLTVSGTEIIRILLGPQWDSAGAIFGLFGPGIGAMQLYATHGWIHLSLGMADRWLRWGILEAAVAVTLFLLMLGRGPEGIALAWTLSFWILLLPAIWYAGRPIRLRVSLVIGVIWKYAAASLAAGYATAMMVGPMVSMAMGLIDVSVASRTFLDAVGRMLFIIPVFSALYLIGVIFLHGSLAPVRRLVRLIREMVPQDVLRRVPTAAPETSN